MNGFWVSQTALYSALSALRQSVLVHDSDTAARIAVDGLFMLEKLVAPADAPPQPIPPDWQLPQGRARKLQEDQAPDAAEPAAAAPEPKGRARSATQNTGRAGGVWTAERDELLRRLWTEGKTAAEALPELNALPAASVIASKQAIYARASFLRIKRPPAVAAVLLRRAGRIGAERAAEMAAAGVSTLGAKPLVWSQERLDAGRVMWEAGERAEDMLPRLNALPGQVPIAEAHVIRTQAAKQKWQRPQHFLEAKRAAYAERMRAMRAARELDKPTAPTAAPGLGPLPAEQAAKSEPLEPESSEPKPSDLAPKPVDLEPRSLAEPVRAGNDKAEAFDLFSRGASVRAVAAELDESLSVVGAWHTEWRSQEDAAT